MGGDFDLTLLAGSVSGSSTLGWGVGRSHVQCVAGGLHEVRRIKVERLRLF